MPPDIEVDLDDLVTIADGLGSAATSLEALAPGVPTGTVAGPMTAVISSMLSQIVTSTGNVQISLEASAANVELARMYYQRADAEAGASFDVMAEAVEES